MRIRPTVPGGQNRRRRGDPLLREVASEGQLVPGEVHRVRSRPEQTAARLQHPSTPRRQNAVTLRSDHQRVIRPPGQLAEDRFLVPRVRLHPAHQRRSSAGGVQQCDRFHTGDAAEILGHRRQHGPALGSQRRWQVFRGHGTGVLIKEDPHPALKLMPLQRTCFRKTYGTYGTYGTVP